MEAERSSSIDDDKENNIEKLNDKLERVNLTNLESGDNSTKIKSDQTGLDVQAEAPKNLNEDSDIKPSLNKLESEFYAIKPSKLIGFTNNLFQKCSCMCDFVKYEIINCFN